jgi:endonuclease/exonuclease/phosphatase family metal-dependent hydrolase
MILTNILIIAIYAPARKSNRWQFYESLLSLPALNDMDTPKILLGDFNFDLAQPEGRSPYGRVIKTVFKNMHDEKATFHRQQAHSRLDYILVSSDLAPCMRDSTLINSPPSLTDHSALKLRLNIHTVA